MQLKKIALLPFGRILLENEKTDQNHKQEAIIRSVRDIALDIAKVKPKTILLISSTGNVFDDVVSVDYQTSLSGSLVEEGTERSFSRACDMGLLDELNRRAGRDELPVYMMNSEKAESFGIKSELTQASLSVLQYIDKVYQEYKVVQVTAGDLTRDSLYKIGMVLREAIEANQKETYAIILNAFPNTKGNEAAAEYTACIYEDLVNQDYLNIMTLTDRQIQKARAFSYPSLILYLGMLEKIKTTFDLLLFEEEKHERYMTALTSFITQGDFLTSSILTEYKDYEMRRKEALFVQEPNIIKLIRQTANLWLKDRKRMDLNSFLQMMGDDELSEQLKRQRRGLYVTVLKNGKLRGSMGSITPVAENLGEALIHYTIEALSYDPDFIPVEEDELSDLTFVIDLIGEIEEVEDIEKELNPETYGIIVEQGVHREVLLPNIAGIETPAEQIAYAREKAGLNVFTTDPYDRFVIQRFKTEHFES